jgi:hypothetical protein
LEFSSQSYQSGPLADRPRCQFPDALEEGEKRVGVLPSAETARKYFFLPFWSRIKNDDGQYLSDARRV